MKQPSAGSRPPWPAGPGDATVEIASLLDWSAEDVAREIGYGWRRADPEPQAAGGPHWYAVGEPAVAMLRVSEDVLCVAVPAIEWGGQLPLLAPRRVVERARTFGAGDVVWLGAQVAAAAGVRRGQLVLCSSCRGLRAPEQLFEVDPPLCHGCSSLHFGVVY